MCGRFTLRTPAAELVEPFRVPVAEQLPLRFNIAPTQEIATVRRERESPERELVMMRWGLVPFWAKDLRIGSRMINARCETAASKPAFREPFQRRRCLILADGYFEWVAVGKKKQPYYIRMQDKRPFAFAGLWDRWKQDTLSCTILTTDSNDATQHVHDRMPVILHEDDYDLWLDRGMHEADRLQPLLRPWPSEEMIVDPVSTFVNNVRNEGADCVAIQRDLF